MSQGFHQEARRIVAMKRLLAGACSLLCCSYLSMAQTSPQEYYQMLENMYRKSIPLIQPAEVEDHAIILDTREMNEYVVSHIPGSRLVPYESFRLGALEDLDKDATIVVYCSVGYRSERIGEKLLAAGFSKVYNLYGGIFNWLYTGGEIVNMNNEPTLSIHTYNKTWSQWCLTGDKIW